ncbi:hypothetical protein PVK06_019867 [Gossypium arboreum]|uniref:Retrotransposon Copia-like N-terminal domain-containing protein n=1 Tax=Gossypium arboreum TaxID=29729 RepID=A0ABR0PKX2_GOSAR|nr:hypothetical protein PVK06_019867 [Gossypium arboreum]
MMVGPSDLVVNFNHPLYLHSSDTPSALLISHLLLGVEKYNIWSRSIKIALLAKNKLGLQLFWDEYDALVPFSSCDCDKSGQNVEHVLQQRLFQFLKGFNESYNTVRSQILLMNPFPSVKQAYFMLVQEES